MPACAALKCTNRDHRKNREKGITFHKFPHGNLELTRQWVVNMHRDQWTPSDRAHLCSNHFTNECFDRSGKNIRLRKNVVPTIFDLPNHLQKKSKSRKPPKMRTPAIAPPAIAPPAIAPPAIAPPAIAPPAIAPPAIDPPAIDPSAIAPPAIDPPAINLSAIDPSAIDPPAIDPPAIDSPTNDPPTINPPAFDPPAINPPAFDPLTIDPPAINPPAFNLPTINPPAFDPSTIDPPAFDPPNIDPPEVPSSCSSNMTCSLSKPDPKDVFRDHGYVITDSPKKLKQTLDETVEKLEDSKKKLKIQQQQTRRLKRKVESLVGIIETLREENMISTKCADIIESSFKGVPNEVLKKVLQRKEGKGATEYSEEMKSFSKTLHLYSGRAYNYVRRTFDLALPHPRQIRRWYKKVNKVNKDTDLTKQSLSGLKTLPEYDKTEGNVTVVPVMLDDMEISGQMEIE